MADPDDTTREEADLQRLGDEERKRRFAAAITKAEFGRFYWDDDLERRLRTALDRPRKPSAPRK